MKKTAVILSLILVLAILMSPSVFASGLSIVSITPKDGEKGKQPISMAVKVTFSENMMDEAAIAANESKFHITDPEGNEIPFQISYIEDKYPNELWIILNETLASNTEYHFAVDPGVRSASGSTLDQAFSSVFYTRNTKTDTTVSFVLMVVMMGAMFFASAKAAKKKQEEAVEPVKAAKNTELNPYKIAKERGISLDEAKVYVEKEKARIAKKQEKYEKEQSRKEEALAAQMAEVQKKIEEEEAAARAANNFRVKGPRSVKAAGGRIPRSVIKKNKAKRAARAKK